MENSNPKRIPDDITVLKRELHNIWTEWESTKAQPDCRALQEVQFESSDSHSDLAHSKLVPNIKLNGNPPEDT